MKKDDTMLEAVIYVLRKDAKEPGAAKKHLEEAAAMYGEPLDRIRKNRDGIRYFGLVPYALDRNVNARGADHAAARARKARIAGDEATWNAERASLLLTPIVEVNLQVESADTSVLSPAVRKLLETLTANPNADTLNAVIDSLKNL